MKILAIETSCDDTGMTMMEARGTNFPTFRILADELANQAKLHSSYGGVYPNLAKNEHIKNLPILFKKVTKKSKVKKADAIMVTTGPGLEPSLWTGITFAEKLAKEWKVPLVPVNHMAGHIISVFGKNKGSFKIPKVKFPVLSLLVSGGHTELVISRDFLKHKVIGRTLDDAAGEAFDKVARMLGLPYPGGPEISRLAEKIRNKKYNSKFSFPRPMIGSKNLDFSFSGLKTSVLYFTQKNKNFDKSLVAMEFEDAVIETLVFKTKKAIEENNIKTLIVGGGVAANKHLRRELVNALPDVKILFPTLPLARDNAVMIGMAGYLNYLKSHKRNYKIRAHGSLRLGEMIK